MEINKFNILLWIERCFLVQDLSNKLSTNMVYTKNQRGKNRNYEKVKSGSSWFKEIQPMRFFVRVSIHIK